MMQGAGAGTGAGGLGNPLLGGLGGPSAGPSTATAGMPRCWQHRYTRSSGKPFHGSSTIAAAANRRRTWPWWPQRSCRPWRAKWYWRYGRSTSAQPRDDAANGSDVSGGGLGARVELGELVEVGQKILLFMLRLWTA